MATISVKEIYKRIVEDLWPTGLAWRQVREEGSFLNKMSCLLSSEVQRIDERIADLVREADPKTTFEMIDDWEEFLNIPDECTPEDYDPSLFERRLRICQKLLTGGGQTAEFYILIAGQLGYDTDVLDVKDFKDFRVGSSQVGDRLTNGSNPATGWAYTFAIVAPATLIRKFTVSQSTVGERLVLVSNDELQCVIEKFKPAHTNVIFSFDDSV